MKRAGLSLISISLLLICVVVFQNCGEFNSVRDVASQASSIGTGCPAGYTQGLNGACVPPITLACTAGAMQACAISNGTGAQTCSSSNAWGSCVATACNSGFTLATNACTTTNTALACNGTFVVQFGTLGSTTVLFTENSSGTINISLSGQTLGAGTCSTGGSPGTATYTLAISTLTETCAGSYTITGGKTKITGTCNPNSVPFTATEQ